MAKDKIPEEQIEAARQVSLLDYMLRFEPDLLVRKGNEYRTPNGHSSLSISLDGSRWYWFAGQIGGGNALYYLTQVEKMPFRQAVERLTGAELPRTLSRPPPHAREPKEAFALPPQCRYSDRATEYLTGRGIDREIVQHCIRQGTIYESYPHHNVVFIGRDSSGDDKFACLRGTVSGQQFRMDQKGSDKRYGFLFVPPGCDPTYQRWIAAFEAPIDALSFVTLNRHYHICPINWDSLPCLALSGTAPAALLQYLRDHPRTDTVYLCLDNDDAGKAGVEKIAQAIRADPDLSKQVKHIKSALPSPEYGKDYNEVLQTLLAAQQAEKVPAPPLSR